MMITKRDIQKINKDVVDINMDWAVIISIYNQKSVQKDWNAIMREVSSEDVEYDIINNVPCSVFDKKSFEYRRNIGGKVDDGERRISIPYTYNDNGTIINCKDVITSKSLIVFQTEGICKWFIRDIKHVQGEIFISLSKVV